MIELILFEPRPLFQGKVFLSFSRSPGSVGAGWSVCGGAFLSLSHMVSASLNERAVVGPLRLWIYPGRDQRSGVWLGAFSQGERGFSSPG